jgi:hypothetical protein
MREPTRTAPTTLEFTDLFGMCDVRGADLVGQPDHLPDAQRSGQKDVGEGLLGLRGSSFDQPDCVGSAVTDHVEPVACARCESNSSIYTARACCQERLRISLCAFPMYLAAREMLVTRNLSARQELLAKFSALHGVAQAENLKSLVSSMWSKRGGSNGGIFEDGRSGR